MARDDKALNGLLQRIEELQNTVERIEAQRKDLALEAAEATHELEHIKETLNRAFK